MAQFDVRCDRCGEEGSARRMDLKDGVCFYCREEGSVPVFKETDVVGFDSNGFAVHKRCGKKLVESSTVSKLEGHNLKQDGTTKRAYSNDNGTEYDGVWCEQCNVRIVLEKVEPAKQEVGKA